MLSVTFFEILRDSLFVSHLGASSSASAFTPLQANCRRTVWSQNVKIERNIDEVTAVMRSALAATIAARLERSSFLRFPLKLTPPAVCVGGRYVRNGGVEFSTTY